MPQNNMKLRDLLDIATSELKELTSLENPDFRLEQAEYKKNEKAWDIVVSFLVPNTNKRLMADLSAFQFHRKYKRVTINDNKEIVGFYIYDTKE